MSDKSELNKILSPGNQDYSANPKGNETPIAKVHNHLQRQATSITE